MNGMWRCCAVVLLAVLTAAVAAPPALADEHLEARLIELEKSAWEAWKNADPAPFKAHLAADGRVILADGSVAGKEAVLEQIASGLCEVAGYELSDFKVRQLGAAAALLTYSASQDAVCEGVRIPSRLVVSSTWEQQDGEWLNVLYQETAVHQPEGDH